MPPKIYQHPWEYFCHAFSGSFLLCLVMLFASIPSEGAYQCRKQVKFDHYRVENGLSQNEVFCCFQDSHGFIWFGTGNGLSRFDGYEFKNYKHDPDDSSTINSGFIYSIVEDSKGCLWLTISGNGLSRFDPRTEKFHAFRSDDNDPGSISSNIVNALLYDDHGHLWIGTAEGLDRLPPGSSEFIHYRNDPDNPNSLSQSSILSLYEDNTGSIWIGTSRTGVNQLTVREKFRENPEFIRYLHSPENPESLPGNSVQAIFEDQHGTLWFGTENGLSRFDRNLKNFISYQTSPNPNSLSGNDITAINEDKNGILWIACKGSGLNSLQRSKDIYHPEIHRYIHNNKDPNSLSNEEISALCYDRSGALWIGTMGDGVDKIIPGGKGFQYYKIDDTENRSRNNKNNIISITEDSRGNLWIAESEGNVYELNPQKEIIQKYVFNTSGKNDHSRKIITKILEDRDKNLWFGTEEDGLIFLNPRTQEQREYTANPKVPDALGSNVINDICEDHNGNLWIGTVMGGLNFYNTSTGQFKRFWHNPDDSKTISSNFIYTLQMDRYGNLWIGTHVGGLNVLKTEEMDSPSPVFIHYNRINGDLHSLSSDIVTAIFEDRAGTIWVGTHGGGLNQFVPETNSFVRYTIRDGLPDNIIYGILEDSNGNLWISTNRGISHFHPCSKSFTNYDQNEGLQGNEFNKGSAFKSQTGEMYFGGINGFNTFVPEKITIDPNPPQIAITDFQIFNTSIEISKNQESHDILNKSITFTDSLYLSYEDRVISFQCAALNYQCPGQNQYAYMLEGYDRDWHYSGDRRFFTYTNLPPGKYFLKIKTANSDNVWNKTPKSLFIYIAPPFWKTIWFKILVVAGFLMIAYSLHRIRVRSLNRKRQQLEIQMAEKSKSAKALADALAEVEKLKNRLEAEKTYLQDEIKLEHNFANIITRSDALKKILLQVEQVASTDSTVLITGESGTGKELISRAIHNISRRKDHTLVKVDCSALPPNLIESELFGHEKGAFTGAIAKKTGRFEIADGGTIFLDEIGELPLKLQTKLLRILQDNEFERIGGTKTISIDVRVLAATNRDLIREIEEGKFREDLYYRLNVFPIHMPPLRDRKEDIPLLTRSFVKKYGQKLGKNVQFIPQSVIDDLCKYNWPGNVRELENVIQRAIIVTQNDKLQLGDRLSKGTVQTDQGPVLSMDDMQKVHIIKALEVCQWRISGPKGAAKLLQMNAKTLYSRMIKLNIAMPKDEVV